MNAFLKKYSTIPHNFINDFYVIAKEEYRDNELVIDFNIVVKWLDTRKDNLKEILLNNFEEHFDYVQQEIIKKHKTGASKFIQIHVTPNCFKELCMISQTKKAKEVRKYFIAMEQLVKRYHEEIDEKMRNEIGLLKINQKPKTKIKSGVVYILRALNTDDLLHKIGKTNGLSGRLSTYNSGNANDMEPEFIIPVKDITIAENCIKAALRNFRYRKYKDVFEIDIEQLKIIFEKCADIADEMNMHYEKKKVDKKLQRSKQYNDKFILFIVNDADDLTDSDDLNNTIKIKHKSKSKSIKVQKGGYNDHENYIQIYNDNKKMYGLLTNRTL